MVLEIVGIVLMNFGLFWMLIGSKETNLQAITSKPKKAIETRKKYDILVPSDLKNVTGIKHVNSVSSVVFDPMVPNFLQREVRRVLKSIEKIQSTEVWQVRDNDSMPTLERKDMNALLQKFLTMYTEIYTLKLAPEDLKKLMELQKTYDNLYAEADKFALDSGWKETFADAAKFARMDNKLSKLEKKSNPNKKEMAILADELKSLTEKYSGLDGFFDQHGIIQGYKKLKELRQEKDRAYDDLNLLHKAMFKAGNVSKLREFADSIVEYADSVQTFDNSWQERKKKDAEAEANAASELDKQSRENYQLTDVSEDIEELKRDSYLTNYTSKVIETGKPS